MNEMIARPRSNGSMPIRVLMADPDSHHVKQLAMAAVLEAFEASESQSERVELDIEVAPVDNWQSRRCALSET